MGKYFVIATCWDSERNEKVKVIAGEFARYVDAALFRDAYNTHYHADAYVIDEFRMMNV